MSKSQPSPHTPTRSRGHRLGVALLLVSSSVLAGAIAGGCSSSPDADAPTMTREELLDPETCGKCHEDHYREWSGSMHAYAADDPVFLAMNKRLQRETNGALGDFCIKCHAPMAVKDGLTKDGLNSAELPKKYKGVTCFFCHTVDAVIADHNSGLRHADDLVMRGPFDDAVPNKAHRSMGSDLHRLEKLESSAMCGACHDIVTPKGAHIERTFAEWKQSLFATETGVTCGGCHMKPSTAVRPVANVPGVFARTGHSHTFAGIDRAITPFPNMEEQKAEIDDFLDASIQSSLCVSRRGTSAQIRVVLDNVFAGHSFPSGAAADRRVWVELVAKNAAGETVYSSGAVADDEPVLEGPHDPDLWLMRDHHKTETGEETHIFGHTACYESRILPFPVTADASDPRFFQRNITQLYPRDGTLIADVASVTMRVRMMAIGLEVLDDLIASGDLDPAMRSRFAPLEVGPTLTWTPGSGVITTERGTGTIYECLTRTNQDFNADKYPPPSENTCK